MKFWKDLSTAKRLLLDGQAIGIPTETVYGLAARIDSEEGIRSIFSLKERPFFDPLIVHVSEFSQVDALISAWPPLALFLAAQFWPGPLTLVMPKAAEVNPLITSGLETVAVRMPAHALTRRLIDSVGIPLAAPSANRFGKTSPTTAEHVRQEFPKIFVLDGGPCQVGLESTVLEVKETPAADSILVYRPGAITDEMLTLAAQYWPKPVSVTRAESVASPGHLKHHYMPSIPVVIADRDLDSQALAKVQRELRMPEAKPLKLQMAPNPVIAARELYSELRRLAQLDPKKGHFILVERRLAQTGDAWYAIWDRLERAATLSL